MAKRKILQKERISRIHRFFLALYDEDAEHIGEYGWFSIFVEGNKIRRVVDYAFDPSDIPQIYAEEHSRLWFFDYPSKQRSFNIFTSYMIDTSNFQHNEIHRYPSFEQFLIQRWPFFLLNTDMIREDRLLSCKSIQELITVLTVLYPKDKDCNLVLIYGDERRST